MRSGRKCNLMDNIRSLGLPKVLNKNANASFKYARILYWIFRQWALQRYAVMLAKQIKSMSQLKVWWKSYGFPNRGKKSIAGRKQLVWCCGQLHCCQEKQVAKPAPIYICRLNMLMAQIHGWVPQRSVLAESHVTSSVGDRILDYNILDFR